MKKQVNCKNCNNQFGEIKDKLIELNYKRVSNISYDFKANIISVKCRGCSNYSSITFDKELQNNIDYKKTSSCLLK